MPCNEGRTVSTVMAKADLDILKRTLERRGYRVTKHDTSLSIHQNGDYVGEYKNGELTAQQTWGGEPLLDGAAVKRAYAEEVVRTAAKRYGWEYKAKGLGKLQLRKGW